MCAAMALLPGCYFYQLGVGHLAILNGQVPLAEAVAMETDPERRALLQSVPRIRAFATNVLQLRAGDSYTSYFETEQRGITFAVVGSQKTRFEPHTWWFPFTGVVAYKGFFDEADALAEEQDLQAQGYDTFVGASSAYSTLGWFRDPVLTTMLRGGDASLVEILIHEMTHATFYVAGQSDFNEQLASFVGKLGTQRYFAHYHGDDEVLLSTVQSNFDSRMTTEDMIFEVVERLETLYDSGRADAEILRRRKPILDSLSARLAAMYPDRDPKGLEMNNARLMQFRRYSRSADYLEDIWQRSGKNWPRFWREVRIYAAETLGQEDPEAEESMATPGGKTPTNKP